MPTHPWKQLICKHREHNPPQYLYIRSGEEYVHTCPGCGKVTVLTGSPVIWGK